MGNNLTKKEVRTVNARFLNSRYCRLIEKGETLPVGAITLADAREIIWIEDELRRRLILLLGRDFYPPQLPAKPTVAELKVKMKPVAMKPEMKTEGRFRFKITITSSIGSIVARKTVKVDSKDAADIEAREMIEKLGLKKATYKIS